MKMCENSAKLRAHANCECIMLTWVLCENSAKLEARCGRWQSFRKDSGQDRSIVVRSPFEHYVGLLPCTLVKRHFGPGRMRGRQSVSAACSPCA